MTNSLERVMRHKANHMQKIKALLGFPLAAKDPLIKATKVHVNWAKLNPRQRKQRRASRKAASTAFLTSYSFGTALEAKGFHRLGGGAFSQVYGKPGSDRVIKVLSRPDEDAWLDYVKWANKAGYGGSWAPKVYSYKLVKSKNGETFAIASMERLESTLSNTKPREKYSFFSNMFEYAVTYEHEKAKKFTEDLAPGITPFMEAFKTSFNKSEYRYDLHRGNFMFRKDETIVLTDPLCGGKTQERTTRLRAADFAAAA